jgi:hypothetical protein
MPDVNARPKEKMIQITMGGVGQLVENDRRSSKRVLRRT